MRRRQLLHAATAATIAAAGLVTEHPLAPRVRAARAQSGRTLVIIFLRGGCDGLNVIVPHGDDAYYAARPGIAIPAPGAGGDEALDLDGFFGLHPALAPLLGARDAGELAVLPAVHYDEPSLSHFRSQDVIESGSPATPDTGWLGRYLEEHASAALLPAISFGTTLAHAYAAPVHVPSVSNLFDLGLGLEPAAEEERFAILRVAYEQADPIALRYQPDVLRLGRGLLDDHALLSSLPLDEAAFESSDYPQSSFGLQLMQAGALIEADLGLELVTVSLGGWDTHTAQGAGEPDGDQAGRIAELAEGIAAFRADLGGAGDEVLVLTMSEFGRTVHENASGGTDHGMASAWLAIGAGVNGGVHLGGQAWPGLETGALVDGLYLRHTVDYRDVFAEVLREHLGVLDTEVVLPGHVPTPVGFL